MKVLTVFAHPGSRSFCHAVLDRFEPGLERYQPQDVLVQQQKVARAEVLAFVAPVHFLSFPAMLKGWLDRRHQARLLGKSVCPGSPVLRARRSNGQARRVSLSLEPAVPQREMEP